MESVDKLSRVLLNEGHEPSATKRRAVRGDRGHGQGVRQSAATGAARPSRAGAADGRCARQASVQSTANTSQHLQALHAAGLVTREREGTSVHYALAGDEALRVWLALRDVSAARLAEVERAARQYLGDDVEAIGREELLSRLRRAMSCSSTFGRPRSTPPGTSRGRARSRSTSSTAIWASCPPTARSWRTAAARSARTPTRRSGSCTAPVVRRGGSTRAGPNGSWRSAPSSR